MRLSTLPLITAVAAMLLPASAVASPPGATTGAATGVTDTAATLNGTVNPNKEETNYWFDYGTSPAYGSKTAPVSAGGGNAGKSVNASLTGLAPSTTYHFRLVSQNASGSDLGQDATFTTLGAGTAPPTGTVTLAASTTIITFGQQLTLSGQATGNGAPGAQLTLQQTPFPFTAPFAATGTPLAADATGRYGFTVAPALATRYRVEAKTSPPSTSATVDVAVRPSIGFRVSDSAVRRGRRVRFSGTVAPAHDGAVAQLQRRIGTSAYRTIAKLTLRHSTKPGRSVYGKTLRVRRTATYRVTLAHDADHADGMSRARRVRAR